MDYYLKTPDNEDGVFIGSSTDRFNKFWPDMGWDLLEKLVEQKPELLEYTNIIGQNGNTYSVPEFYQKVYNILHKGEKNHGREKKRK